MPLLPQWGRAEDFATLFQYFWHRDFPMDRTAVAAKRADWTMHIGVIVRSIGDLMGLATRFERGGRKDALLRSRDGDEIGLEWEWDGVKGNELEKLRKRKAWSFLGDKNRPFKYSVLISYAQVEQVSAAYHHVGKEWEGADWPLLLVLITFQDSSEFRMGRDFQRMECSVFDSGGHRHLRDAPATPWNLESTRWPSELGGDQAPTTIT